MIHSAAALPVFMKINHLQRSIIHTNTVCDNHTELGLIFFSVYYILAPTVASLFFPTRTELLRGIGEYLEHKF